MYFSLLSMLFLSHRTS